LPESKDVRVIQDPNTTHSIMLSIKAK